MSRAQYRGKDLCDLTDDELEQAVKYMRMWAAGFLTNDGKEGAKDVLDNFYKEYDYEVDRRLRAKTHGGVR